GGEGRGRVVRHSVGQVRKGTSCTRVPALPRGMNDTGPCLARAVPEVSPMLRSLPLHRWSPPLLLALVLATAVQAQSTNPLPPLPDSRADPAAGAGAMAPMRTGSKEVQAQPPPPAAAAPRPPSPAPAAPAPGAGPSPSAAQPAPPPATSDEAFQTRVKTLEEQVVDLKEKIYRSKARLLLLQETVLGGDLSSGARAVLVHKNDMGGTFALESVAYA